MADKFLAAGTAPTPVASGNITATNPTGLANNDVLICMVASNDAVNPSMPAGWNTVTGFPISGGSGIANPRMTLFWKAVTNAASESGASVTITHTAGNVCMARIFAFRGLDHTAPIAASNTQANGSSATVTMPTVTPTAAGQTIIFCGVIADDGAFGAVSGTDPTPTERWDLLSATGNDVSALFATGERTASTATGNRTSTNARTNQNVGGQVALKNAGAGGTQDTLPCDAGSFGVSGTAATLRIARAVTADGGSFGVSGTAATLSRGYPMPADGGSFDAIGTPATLTTAYRLGAASGSFSTVGADADLVYTPGATGETLTADPGSFGVSGTDAALRVAVVLVANGGSFASSGQSATPRVAYRLTAGAGAFGWDGTQAQLSDNQGGSENSGRGCSGLSGLETISAPTMPAWWR